MGSEPAGFAWWFRSPRRLGEGGAIVLAKRSPGLSVHTSPLARLERLAEGTVDVACCTTWPGDNYIAARGCSYFPQDDIVFYMPLAS